MLYKHTGYKLHRHSEIVWMKKKTERTQKYIEPLYPNNKIVDDFNFSFYFHTYLISTINITSIIGKKVFVGRMG